MLMLAASALRAQTGQPNIIFIMLDDARWDSFTPNGGQPFFPAPNISRIANEGANFKNFFAVLSLCTPSRGTFFTGLYPNKHGATTNPENIDNNGIGKQLPWISEILQESGYYTMLSGKLGFDQDSVRGFDDYLISTSDKYIGAKFNYNGTPNVHFQGEHTTDIITNFVLDKLDTRPTDKPFFVYMAERAPHVPYVPRPQDSGIFDNYVMPYPDNAYKYQYNWPSYLYPANEAGDSTNQDSLYRGYFELLAGVEDNIGILFNYLDSAGLTDNTVIILSSDNGNVKSEHLLQGKQLAFEESMRLPLFIRYPAWFPPGTVVEDQLGLNVDWFSTLLDAAGVTNTYNMDGLSLRKLYTNEVKRTEFLYEIYREEETPSLRAVRTQTYKYIKSFCNDTTEQFFDLVNDPKENTNLINDPYYEEIISYYRCKLDSMRIMMKDFTIDTIIECKLKNQEYSHVGASTNPGPVYACIIPESDVSDPYGATGISDAEEDMSGDYNVWMYNLLGQLVRAEKKYFAFPITIEQINPNGLLPGIYLVQLENDDRRFVKKIWIPGQ